MIKLTRWDIAQIAFMAVLIVALVVVAAPWEQPPEMPEKVVVKPEVEELMSDYVVNDAGDASYNGEYSDNGDTCNGEPVYEIEGGGRYLYLIDEEELSVYIWVLHNSVIPYSLREQHDYYNDDSSAPAAGSWSVGDGIPSAPTTARAFGNWPGMDGSSDYSTDRKHSIYATMKDFIG